MNCDEARLLMPERAAGRLEGGEAKLLAEHLATCESCRREAAGLHTAAGLAAAAFERNAPRVPGGLAERIVAGLKPERAPARRRRKTSARLAAVRRRPARLVFWGAIAAAAAALFVAGRAFVPGGAPRGQKVAGALERPPMREPAVASSDVEDHEEFGTPADVAAPESAHVADVAPEPEATPEGLPVEIPEAPAAVEEPRVAGSARPDRRAGHLCYLDVADGQIEFARGDEWSTAAQGMAFVAGDRLRTKFSRARVAFESGSALYVNRFTTLTMTTDGAPGIELIGGEVYVEVADADTGFWVETSRGRAVDRGTRFGVKDGAGGTTVVVAEGAVEASTDQGSRTLSEDQEVLLVRRTSLPGAVRRARNLERRLAWALGGALAAGRPRERLAAVIQPALPDASYSTRNVLHVLALVDGACARGARLVVLPACTVYGGVDLAARAGAPLDETSDLVRAFAQRAKRHRAYVAASFYLRDEAGAVRHEAVLFGPEGRIATRQVKTNLASKEVADGVRAGSGFVVADTELGKVGMLISKDVYSGRAAWSEEYARRGVTCVLVLNSDPDTKRYEEVLKPLAAERGATVLIANHVYGRTTRLSSAYLPDGSVRATGAGEGIVMVKLTTHTKGAPGR